MKTLRVLLFSLLFFCGISQTHAAANYIPEHVDPIALIFCKINPIITQLQTTQLKSEQVKELTNTLANFKRDYDQGTSVLYGAHYNTYICFKLVRCMLSLLLTHAQHLKGITRTEIVTTQEILAPFFSISTLDSFGLTEESQAQKLLRFFQINYSRLTTLWTELFAQATQHPSKAKASKKKTRCIVS